MNIEGLLKMLKNSQQELILDRENVRHTAGFMAINNALENVQYRIFELEEKDTVQK